MKTEKLFVASTYEAAIEIFAEAFRGWNPDTSTIEFHINSSLYNKMDRTASIMLICGQPVIKDDSLKHDEIKIVYNLIESAIPAEREKETILYLVNIKPEHKEKFTGTLIHSRFCGTLVNQTNDMFYFELFEGRAIVIIPHSWIEFMAPIEKEI